VLAAGVVVTEGAVDGDDAAVDAAVVVAGAAGVVAGAAGVVPCAVDMGCDSVAEKQSATMFLRSKM
jgi:hypothetical protein